MSENGLIIQDTGTPAFWLSEAPLAELHQAVKKYGGELRAVGGAVRDRLLQTESGDIDFACDLHPQAIKQVAQDLSADIRLHGESHGTVMVILHGKAYEVTSLRRDIKTFGRHAEVEFGGDWHSDALRRDFTVNAMSMDAAGKIYDYCGGLRDLQEGPMIRFVGDASLRIQEDYLRILRFFRFYAMLKDSRLQQEALPVCATHAEALADLSVERRRDEFIKLLAGTQAPQALSLMSRHGILQAMDLPAEVPVLPSFIKDGDIHSDFAVNFYILSFVDKDPDKNIEDFCRSWRLDNQQKRLLLKAENCAAALISGGESPDYLLQLHGREAVALAVALKGDNSAGWQHVMDWQAQEFPIDGHDIKSLFAAQDIEGAAVGKHLERGLRHWLAHGRGLSRDELLLWYKKLANSGDIP